MIEGCYIVIPNHPSKSRRGCVCIYYKHSLAWKALDNKYFQECIVFQVLIANYLCSLISSSKSSSQPIDVFDQFTDNLELILDEIVNQNLFAIAVLGDFYVKSKNSDKHDKTSYKGTKTDALTKQFNLD